MKDVLSVFELQRAAFLQGMEQHTPSGARLAPVSLGHAEFAFQEFEYRYSARARAAVLSVLAEATEPLRCRDVQERCNWPLRAVSEILSDLHIQGFLRMTIAGPRKRQFYTLRKRRKISKTVRIKGKAQFTAEELAIIAKDPSAVLSR